MTPFDSPWTLGQVMRFCDEANHSLSAPIDERSIGLFAVVPKISLPKAGARYPIWEVRLDRDTPVALNKIALRELEQTLDLNPEYAVWGSGHFAPLISFRDFPHPVLPVLGRDHMAPTWKEHRCLPAGYAGSFSGILSPQRVAVSEMQEEVVITIPDPSTGRGRVALTWWSDGGTPSEREALARAGLTELPTWSPPRGSLLSDADHWMGHTILILWEGKLVACINEVVPVYDEKYCRYDLVFMGRVQLSCSIWESRLYLTEVQPDGQPVDRPVGLLDAETGNIVVAWQRGQRADPEVVSRCMSQSVPTLAGALKYYQAWAQWWMQDHW